MHGITLILSSLAGVLFATYVISEIGRLIKTRRDEKSAQTSGNGTKNHTTPSPEPKTMMITNTILIIVCAMIFLGIYRSWKNPGLDDIWNFGSSHSVYIISLLIFTYILITINPDTLGKAKGPAQYVVVGIAVLIFVIAPMKGCVTSQSKTVQNSTLSPEIPLTGKESTQWSEVIIPPRSNSKRIPVPTGMSVTMRGNDFLIHCLYRDGQDISFRPGTGESCPSGDMPFVYAENKRTDDENIVSYVYVR